MWLGEALNHPTNLVVGVINDPTSPSPSSISLVYFPISPDSLSLELSSQIPSRFEYWYLHVQWMLMLSAKNHFAVDNDMEAESPGHSKYFFTCPLAASVGAKIFVLVVAMAHS
jgi:hypothetical protein